MINYKKYKWFFTKSGKLVVGGKNAESNDALINELKSMRKEMIVMHTKAPGSPFCAIIASIETVTKSDIDECAVFTGCFSKAWKEGCKIARVHIFKLSQLGKTSDMKSGTWRVKGKVKNIEVNLKLAITKQNGIVRAVPTESVDSKDLIAIAFPGKIDKTKEIILTKIDKIKELNKDQLLSALPAGGVKLEK